MSLFLREARKKQTTRKEGRIWWGGSLGVLEPKKVWHECDSKSQRQHKWTLQPQWQEPMVPVSSPLYLNVPVCWGWWSCYCLTDLGQQWESTLTIISNIYLNKITLHSIITFFGGKNICVFIYVCWKTTRGYKIKYSPCFLRANLTIFIDTSVTHLLHRIEPELLSGLSAWLLTKARSCSLEASLLS